MLCLHWFRSTCLYNLSTRYYGNWDVSLSIYISNELRCLSGSEFLGRKSAKPREISCSRYAGKNYRRSWLMGL